ncbi:hypothetical protein MAPG_05789 [Magnaporthiopsis poae ATCC 64411]|uniref:Aminoglycoside phosphotransferase domain-containing protein n=1 Tax=Magnaporthiopsis poae (strain ATCC 64411 / 73-15) TaxID=644358 RepID=A0A0C4E0B9_MAGP6|nr:hypothetical protein MAPG_05789 [Magnaporthiopsis poae ATCC 64411]
MGAPTNHELNAKREQHCISVTPERKYYRCGNAWIKRSLRPTEWQKHGGFMFVPKFNTERILNEGACLRFVAEHTDIPVPRLHACFEDDGAAYLITEFVEGVALGQLEPAQQKMVVPELERHIAALKELTSAVWGGPDGLVLPPYRIMRKSKGHPWHMRRRNEKSLVFCHNDLSANNIIVDPYTLRIKAIIDWEYAGFFPAEFDRPFYLRPGPPVALHGEFDDVAMLEAVIDRERVYGHGHHASHSASTARGSLASQSGSQPSSSHLRHQ